MFGSCGQFVSREGREDKEDGGAATRFHRRKALEKLARNLRFTETRAGLRIDMVDEADFSMFISGTDILTPDAAALTPARYSG